MDVISFFANQRPTYILDFLTEDVEFSNKKSYGVAIYTVLEFCYFCLFNQFKLTYGSVILTNTNGPNTYQYLGETILSYRPFHKTLPLNILAMPCHL